MVEQQQQQYMPSGLPHPGDLPGQHGLPDNSRPSAPPTTSYQDIAPFSAVCPGLLHSALAHVCLPMMNQQVASFNLPAQCDSSLLTPISTGGSPPLNQGSKLDRQYPPPPSTPYTQVPTPPGSSRMYHHQWNNQFDMNSQASQASSPMNNTQAPVAQAFYMQEDRRTPGPPEPYLGSYGVSEGPETQPIHHAGPPYYVDVSMEQQNQMMMRENAPMPMDRNAPPPAPLLSQPHPSHYRPARRPSMEDPRIHRSLSDSPRRRVTHGNTRVKKARASRRQPASNRGQSQSDHTEDHKNCHGDEVPPKLKPTCPDEERCIFESRWRHRHQRGQDMWDSIQSDFLHKFNKSHGKEMLQMKFKRGRSKYIEWLSKDELILLDAWKRVEKDRYELILKYFLDMGGSRNMLLSASDIEIKIVNDLRLEDAVYVDVGDLDLRRRRRATVKKRSGGRGEPGGDVAVSDDMLVMNSHTPHNEDDVINQVYARRDRWDDEPSTNSEMMDVQPMWDNRAPMKMEPGLMHPAGDQMARQSCEQLHKVHPANGNPHAPHSVPVPVHPNIHPGAHPSVHSNVHSNGHPVSGSAAVQSLYHHRKGS